jgi:hypothetical protein
MRTRRTLARAQTRKLEELLDEKLNSFSQKISVGEFDPATEDFTRIEQLAKVLTLLGERGRAGQNLFPPLALIASLLVAAVLVFVRVGAVDASFDLVASAVRFETSESGPLIGLTRCEELGVSGAAIVFPRTYLVALSQTPGPNPSTDHIFLKTESPDSADDITLAHIKLLADTGVSIASTYRKFGYRFSFTTDDRRAAGLTVEANVKGRLGVALPSPAAPAVIDFGSAPKQFKFEGGTEPLEISLILRVPLSVEFYSQNIKKIDFQDHEVFPGMQSSRVVSRSTLVSGTVYFDSLGGQKVDLRPGELIIFDAKNCRLDSLKLGDESISMRIHGTVEGLQRGDAANRISMMPTLLQWLVARQPVALGWGAVLWFFGVFTAVWNWHKPGQR